jgi:decaprenylphospho-beta-D-ribofuranose 2-oxidase
VEELLTSSLLDGIPEYSLDAESIWVRADLTLNSLMQQCPDGWTIYGLPTFLETTVGGGVAVAAHGSTKSGGGFLESITSIEVLCDSGLVEANRSQHKELFFSTIGGLGSTGLITRVKIRLSRDLKCINLSGSKPLDEFTRKYIDQLNQNALIKENSHSL